MQHFEAMVDTMKSVGTYVDRTLGFLCCGVWISQPFTFVKPFSILLWIGKAKCAHGLTPKQDQLKGVEQIASTHHAFAAVLEDGMLPPNCVVLQRPKQIKYSCAGTLKPDCVVSVRWEGHYILSCPKLSFCSICCFQVFGQVSIGSSGLGAKRKQRWMSLHHASWTQCTFNHGISEISGWCTCNVVGTSEPEDSVNEAKDETVVTWGDPDAGGDASHLSGLKAPWPSATSLSIWLWSKPFWDPILVDLD